MLDHETVNKLRYMKLTGIAEAVKEVFHAPNEIRIIGTRHGEKQHETLLTREEYFAAEDMGGYFRIPADTRDLNYDKYFVEGSEELSLDREYNSGNTERLAVEGIKKKLLALPYVQNELKIIRNGGNGR